MFSVLIAMIASINAACGSYGESAPIQYEVDDFVKNKHPIPYRNHHSANLESQDLPITFPGPSGGSVHKNENNYEHHRQPQHQDQYEHKTQYEHQPQYQHQHDHINHPHQYNNHANQYDHPKSSQSHVDVSNIQHENGIQRQEHSHHLSPHQNQRIHVNVVVENENKPSHSYDHTEDRNHPSSGKSGIW